MKFQAWLPGILVVGLVAQLAVPARMIIQREQALRLGVAYRFRVAPVDPYDAFRGRYVALNLAERSAPTKTVFQSNQVIYLRLENDTNGFARLAEAAVCAGRKGVWMRAHASYGNGWDRRSAQPVSVRLPFDRFYLDEESAPRAEQLYRTTIAGRNGAASNAWLQVRVYRNLAVIEDLYLNGRPIRQVLSAP